MGTWKPIIPQKTKGVKKEECEKNNLKTKGKKNYEEGNIKGENAYEDKGYAERETTAEMIETS
jgi:hypothetical protein